MAMAPSAKKKQSKRLNIDRLYEAASKAEAALPEMVETLISDFYETKTVKAEGSDEEEEVSARSSKEKVMILRALQATSLQKPRMEDAEGLIKKPVTKGDHPLLSILGGVKIEVLNQLPQEKQEKLLLDYLHHKPLELPEATEEV